MSSRAVRIQPQMVVQHYTSQHGIRIEDLGIAPLVVLSWSPTVIERMAKAVNAEISPHWMYRERELLYCGEINGHNVTFTNIPIGAPGTVARMEEMIACGARRFLGLGWAGSLQPAAPVGSFLIPTSCIREDGTSPHYIEDGVEIVADMDLTDSLSSSARNRIDNVFAGLQWTTDAPYRELVSKIEEYRQLDVIGVDMETSAMYALGQYRNVKVANLLVVSDEVWREWHPAFGTPILREATEVAQEVILHCVRELLSREPD